MLSTFSRRRVALIAISSAAVLFSGNGVTAAAPNGKFDATPDISLSPVEIISPTVMSNPAKIAGELSKGIFWDEQRAADLAKQFRPLYVAYTHGVFTSGFGMRWGALHGGIDIANSIGTPIDAVADGVVIKANDAGDGYGNSVKIRHTDGTITHYGHMSELHVSVGQTVLAGDEIGLMGGTGDSTGPHCHFEVFVGGEGPDSRIDPLPWLASRGIDVGAFAG